jgi:YHS domain-containing protein
MKNSNRIKLGLLLVILVISCQLSMAQDEAERQKNFNIEKGVMLSGYDAVSYFSGKPIKGKNTFQYKYKSCVYQFSSQANLDKFKTNPAAFEPSYGGWCAYAMGYRGEKVEVDPETYKIINGKLYLFYNAFFNNTLTDWNKNEANLKKKADASWDSLIGRVK